MSKPRIEDIDALLPQTQCEQCGFAGCKPYAEALSQNKAPINLCPPGGVKGLLSLADLLGKDPSPFLEDMENKSKPPLEAVIREAECIGCAKCIKACPVDAILGSGKLMHTVLSDECTGCELCIAPCPVDCIDMVPARNTMDRRDQFRTRHESRLSRLQNNQKATAQNPLEKFTDKKAYIQAALLRAKRRAPIK